MDFHLCLEAGYTIQRHNPSNLGICSTFLQKGSIVLSIYWLKFTNLLLGIACEMTGTNTLQSFTFFGTWNQQKSGFPRQTRIEKTV